MELGGGGLLAARAGMRMRSRQQYRTMARMQRRRSYVANKMGVREDFSPAGQQAAPEAAAAAAPAGEAADYTVELERLAKLRDDGVITPEDFEAKKKQLLGL